MNSFLCFPLTATKASPSAPPPGSDRHFISGLCCVCDQLCGCHRFSRQEKVLLIFKGLYKTYLDFSLQLTLLFRSPCSKRCKEASIHIHLGLAVSLACLNLLFFFTGVLANVGGESVCVWVGALLHYSLLCSFAWMGLEIFHTFWLICIIFNPPPKPYVWYTVGFGEYKKIYF